MSNSASLSLTPNLYFCILEKLLRKIFFSSFSKLIEEGSKDIIFQLFQTIILHSNVLYPIFAQISKKVSHFFKFLIISSLIFFSHTHVRIISLSINLLKSNSILNQYLVLYILILFFDIFLYS
jgi:hypothetical protein